MTRASAGHVRTEEATRHLVGILREFDSATLVTRSRTGSLHGRPMAIARVDDNVTIWFITSVSSARADEVAEDARAMVTLQSSSRFVCLNGNAELVFDPDQIRSLWRSEYRVWYQSDRDPDIVLVRFTSFDAEYWDGSGVQGLTYVFQSAGTEPPRERRQADRPEEEPESHAKLRLWEPGSE